jgi:CheY-like chemotaxis protein
MARVLFVDDSAVARAVAERLFGERGVPVTTVASSREAARIDPASLGAALLDLELGDGLGTDLARLLRDGSPRLPIAFLTGAERAPLLDEARALGPVFMKTSEVEEAIRWATDAAKTPISR